MKKTPASIEVEKTIRDRRTCKNFDGRPIEKSTVVDLLTLASWAPNHRLNEPWRFRVLSKEGILKLIREIQKDLTPEEAKGFEKNFEKLKTAGTIIYITSATDPSAIVELENFAATSAGIQNILLAATAQGIQSYWGTGKLAQLASTRRFLKIENDEKFVGWVWLGYGEVGEGKARTPIEAKTLWFD